MKTSYNIIWIDDEPSSTDTDQEDVKDFLDEYGIRADITFVEAPADGSIKEKLEHHLKDPDLDLLMVDYHMEGLSGDQLVKLIRDTNHIYLPVIFYSSTTVELLLDAVRGAALDGVYIANRDFLLNKVKDVVGSLLVKEQTVKQVRGLLMEGVSEIDVRFNDIFYKAWEECTENQKGTLESYLRKIISDRAKSAKKKSDEFPPDAENFKDHITTQFLTASYDTYTRWRMTKKALELIDHPSADIQELTKFVTRDDDVPPLNGLRNDYAHKSRNLLADEHTVEKCIQIRRELRAQFANIDLILGSE